jgi:hypothetical protein
MSAQPAAGSATTPLVPNPPTLDKTKIVKRRGRRFVYGSLAILLGLLAGTIAFVLTYPIVKTVPQPLARGADLAAVLAPIAVAALGIERIIEMMWNLIESYIRSLVAFLAGRSEWLRWANDELKAARERLEALAHEGDPTLRVDDMLTTSQDALSQLIERAADDVALAEARLATLTSTGQYVDAKRVISIVTSLILGLVIAAVVGLQMFALLGINVNERIDVLITGIAIGTGATPVHSLIGILQQGKDTLDGVQGLLKTRAAATQQQMSNDN